MSAPLTTRLQVTPEWVEALASALVAAGWAWRAGPGASIQVMSPNQGWMWLLLPGGGCEFENKATRDIAVAAVLDAVGRLQREACEPVEVAHV